MLTTVGNFQYLCLTERFQIVKLRGFTPVSCDLLIQNFLSMCVANSTYVYVNNESNQNLIFPLRVSLIGIT